MDAGSAGSPCHVESLVHENATARGRPRYEPLDEAKESLVGQGGLANLHHVDARLPCCSDQADERVKGGRRPGRSQSRVIGDELKGQGRLGSHCLSMVWPLAPRRRPSNDRRSATAAPRLTTPMPETAPRM